MLDIIFCNTAIEIPKKVNTKINTRITSNRGHRNRYEDAVVPPYGRMRGRATAALPPHIHLLQACDPARMQEGYKAKDKKESSTHREHPLQGNSSHRHSRPSGNKDTRGNGDKCGDKKASRTDTVREALIQRRRLPTLPHCIAVPSA